MLFLFQGLSWEVQPLNLATDITVAVLSGRLFLQVSQLNCCCFFCTTCMENDKKHVFEFFYVQISSKWDVASNFKLVF